MGLIKGFENDIFISYAHADNLNGPAGDDPSTGWVLSFASMLKNTLKDTLKKEISQSDDELKIYWDDRIAKGEPLDWQLNPAVEKSAIFVMVMSEHYLDSEWCQKEVSWFLENVNKRADLKTNRLWPVFVVSVAKTNIYNWPKDETLRDTMPFEFYDADRHNIDPRYAYPSIALNKTDAAFYPEFNNLQTAITVYFKKALALDGRTTPPPVEAEPIETSEEDGAIQPYSKNDVVIVATDDMARKAQRLVDVCTSIKLTAGTFENTPETTSLAKSGMSDAKVAIFLLGMFPGSDGVSMAAHLSEVYKAAQKSNTRTVIWMQSGRTVELIDDDFEEYLSFIKGLDGSIDNFPFDDFSSKLEEFVPTSEDETDPSTTEKETFVPSKLKLFIDAAKIDHSLAKELKMIIDSKNLNIRTFVHNLGASQQVHNEEWSKVVGRCDGVILVYGAVDIDAIDDKLDQVERLSAKRKSLQKSEISIAIIDAPPLSTIDLSAPKIRMISVEQELDTEKIVDFLTDLSREHANAAVGT